MPRVEFLWWSGCPSWERGIAELREAMEELGLDPERSRCVRSRPRRTPPASPSPARRRSASTASTSPRRSRRRIAADLPGLPAPRRPRLAAPRPRGPSRGARFPRHERARLRAAGHRRLAPLAVGRRTRGDGRLLDLQPLPLRARLGGPDARGLARLRGARRPHARDQLQRRRALSRPTLWRRWPSGSPAEDWPHPIPPRRDPGGRPRLGRREDAARLRPRRRSRGPLPGAPDGDYEDESRDADWVREALDVGPRRRGSVGRPETDAVGCTIKWR